MNTCLSKRTHNDCFYIYNMETIVSLVVTIRIENRYKILYVSSFCIVVRSPDGGKVFQPGNDHSIPTAGAVDNREIPIFIPSAHNTNMFIIVIKHQITGKCVAP